MQVGRPGFTNKLQKTVTEIVLSLNEGGSVECQRSRRTGCFSRIHLFSLEVTCLEHTLSPHHLSMMVMVVVPSSFVFILFFYHLINFIFHWAGSSCCAGTSSRCGEWGLLSRCSAQASHCGSVSYCGAWTLGTRVPQVWFVGFRGWAQQFWPIGFIPIWHVESSWIRDQTCVPCIGRQILIHYTTREILPSSFKRSPVVDGQKLCLDGVAGCRLCAFFLSSQPKKNMERLWEEQVVPQPEMAEKPNTSRQRTW